MARQGNFVEAQLAIDRLRSRYQAQSDAEITIWVNLAEGLVSYFSELGPIARDKVMRAHALSAATGLPGLNALTAAWLAQMDFSILDATSVAVHASEALRLSSCDQHASRCRASIVIAQALHLSGRWDLAAPWYTSARLHATAEGDDLSISALMHNMVSMRLDHFRQVILTGRGEANQVAYAMVGIESSANFDELIGTSTLEALRPLMRARFLSLRGEYPEALQIYESRVVNDISAALSRLGSDVMSDAGWCYLQEGFIAKARSALAMAEVELARCTQIDDRAATHSRLRNTYLGLGEISKAECHEVQAAASWQEFASVQERFVALFENMSPEVFRSSNA
jgi:tetratricopeptide (TPR) repeat protein